MAPESLDVQQSDRRCRVRTGGGEDADLGDGLPAGLGGGTVILAMNDAVTRSIASRR